MRFHRLDLIKYGKFGGQSIDFPASARDFHLVVGANEAGKSTLRSAILDLLFGIPTRSPHGFLHPLNELRLGASIGNASGILEFHRAKAQRQTLRTPLDKVLPDNALVPFLGTADRNFFDQMFGLDHARLVKGGNSILSAENDIGQVLFQSAAGIASLGKIRDSLMEEADSLWAPKKSMGRAYYMAADQLEKAASTLKVATVRTKVWIEANNRLEAVTESLEDVRTTMTALAEKRTRLERVRRTAPYLRVLQDCEQQLREMAGAVELPADAGAALSAAERELAAATKLLELHRADAQNASAALESREIDEAALAAAADITALDERRLQYVAYDHDIQMRQTEIDALWRDIGSLCVQLTWPHDREDALAARLPTLAARKELGQLALERSGLARAVRAAEQAEQAKRAEIDELKLQLAQLQPGEVKARLRAALAGARALGTADSLVQKQQGAIEKARSVLDAALRALGHWQKPVAELEAMPLLSEASVLALRAERQSLLSESTSAARQVDAQRLEVERIALELAQFQERHQPVTRQALEQARQERDAVWQSIKAGTAGLPETAAGFESRVVQADSLADARFDNVEAATELQNLQQQLEREKLLLQNHENLVRRQDAMLRQLDLRWQEHAHAMALPGMALDDFSEWLAKRDRALAASAALEEERRGLALTVRACTDARNELLAALRDAGQEASDADSLATLCMQAESHIQSVDNAKVRFDTLSLQAKTSQSHADTLVRATHEARSDIERWNHDWETALAKAGLPANSTMTDVEAALELIAQVEARLNKMRQIRTERIDTMQADLARFADDADRLAQALAPHLRGQPAPTIAVELSLRLKKAREGHAEAQRIKAALHRANSDAHAAQAAIERTTASLQPLLEKAGADEPRLLGQAIARSDARRTVASEAEKARASLLEQGDGMSRTQIETEVAAADLDTLSAALEQIQSQHSEAVNRQAALTGELKEVEAALAAIGGSDAAAVAEAQRQEALAQMADAAERYIRVYTAGRLLRWSIDRYREEKQGPMLARAGAIFSRLTQGSFAKLVVDFEADPMVLEGVRADGKLVSVSGMSDGTRDQLYLALRLAALELHLEQASPLPFIADDLFINYDDGRSEAGFEALAALSEKTQVIFLSHHDHLVPTVQKVFGDKVNIVHL